MPPLIAIIGRPNVGKSTLFNRIVGYRKAIVGNKPGVTRDRNYASVLWRKRRFLLVDTGGFEKKPDEESVELIREQTILAIEEADRMIFLCDGRAGLTENDDEVVRLLRRSGKPFYVAVNKLDSFDPIPPAEFYRFGAKQLFTLSAEHNIGVEEMLEEILFDLPEELEEQEEEGINQEELEEIIAHAEAEEKRAEEEEEAELSFPLLPETDEDEETSSEPQEITSLPNDFNEHEIRVAIVGRPNVGKSSFVNKVVGKERVIVSPIAGTTRDMVDSSVKVGERNFLLIDTAGIKRKGKVSAKLDKFSVMMSLRAMERCHIALLLIDATEGVTEQDLHIAGYLQEQACGVIVVINKWDLIDNKDPDAYKKFIENVQERFKFLAFAPIITTSALSGQRIRKVFDLIEQVYHDLNLVVRTNRLNKIVKEMTTLKPPPYMGRNRRTKFYYVVQTKRLPVTITFFTNNADPLHFSYERYLKNKLREELGITSAPLLLKFRSKRLTKKGKEKAHKPSKKPKIR